MHKKKSERMLLQTIVLQIKRLKEKKKKGEAKTDGFSISLSSSSYRFRKAQRFSILYQNPKGYSRRSWRESFTLSYLIETDRKSRVIIFLIRYTTRPFISDSIFRVKCR